MTSALEAIERAVAPVTDPTDRTQLVAALRTVSPALVDDVVFGRDAARQGAAADGELLAVGAAAAPGVATGIVATSAAEVLDLVDAGRDAVLVADDTAPGDEPALRLAAAVVTRRGGVAGHAAIVARHLGIPAVCAAGAFAVEAGAVVLVDGGTGEVRRLDAAAADAVGAAGGGAGPVAELPGVLVTLLTWADELAGLRVLANADTPEEAAVAAALGAAGVGLCRVERRLADLGPEPFRNVAVGVDGAEATLVAELASSWEAMADAGRGPLRIRLLDASPGELGLGEEHDGDGPLGWRGVRLALSSEALVRAQARAAAAVARRSEGAVALTVPLVSHPTELRIVRSWIEDEVGGALAVGAMVETPRAALVASALAPLADHLAVGTNDLTQLTWGLSRDEADGPLGTAYRALGVWDFSPFETLDATGVVRLVALAVETARAARPEVVVSMCGEQAADPASIAIAAQLGVDDVSVSPYRVPAARLAAAHAALDLAGGAR